MEPNTLAQSLFINPATPFTLVDAALTAIGWTRELLPQAAPPLIPGEPELASWSWRGGMPRLVATFNPVVRLRVLDVSQAAPALRAAVAARLPLLDPAEAPALLESPDPRGRLRGLLILREAEDIERIEAVERLAEDPVPEVAAVARAAAVHLAKLTAGFAEARRILDAVQAEVAPMLSRLHRPEVVEALRPREGDAAEAFHPSVAAEAAEAYARLWQDAPRLRGVREAVAVAATAGMLRSDNRFSRNFHPRYRDIAAWLQGEKIWLTWRRGPEGQGSEYEGLVFLDGRWVWFPRPWEALAGALEGRLGQGS